MASEKQKLLDVMPPDKRSRLIGDIVTLMTASKTHQNYKIKHFASVVLPPLNLNQFRIYHDAKKRPMGFVSWAMLDKKAEQKLLHDAAPLTLAEWASGDIVYVMEFIAPYGHAQRIIKDLKTRYPGHKAHAVRYDTTGKNGKTITTFYGDGVREGVG